MLITTTARYTILLPHSHHNVEYYYPITTVPSHHPSYHRMRFHYPMSITALHMLSTVATQYGILPPHSHHCMGYHYPMLNIVWENTCPILIIVLDIIDPFQSSHIYYTASPIPHTHTHTHIKLQHAVTKTHCTTPLYKAPN